MSKLIFAIVVSLAVFSSALAFQVDPALGKTKEQVENSMVGCFAKLLIPEAALSKAVVNKAFVEEITDFVIRSHTSIYDSNSKYKECLNKIDMTPFLSECKEKSGVACEVVDKILAVRTCPAGHSRVVGTYTSEAASCYEDCPKDFTTNGAICTKPDSYVLNHYRSELECASVNGGKQCSIYHVRYFVPDCKENFYRLGSTVCIPSCPKNFADHETFCVRPNLSIAKDKIIQWRL